MVRSVLMVRRLNSIPLKCALVVFLCILSIYVYNTIFHRQYYQQNHVNNNDSNHIVIDSANHHPPNATVKIKRIVDAQRQAIASEMKDFNFTEQMVGLSALTPETNGQPLRSVILSGFRSGSTFFGDILNAMPGNYYHYEPLSYYKIGQVHSIPKSIELINTLRQLLNCNYTGLEDYLEFGKKNHYVFEHNIELWQNFHQYPKLCFDPKLLNPFCRLFPFQSMKVIRLRANLSEQLLIDPSLNVKIVLSIRDPRGVIQSRKQLNWCFGQPGCDNLAAKIICEDMVSDFKAAEILTKKYPLRFRVIRYEDLSLDPFNVTKDILNFYGLPFHPNVKKFLDSHTRSNTGGPFSTKRNSKATAFHWMRDLSFYAINQIQKHCSEAMFLWGYKKADNENSLINNTFNPLEKFPFASTTATDIVTQEEQQSDENE